MALGVLAVCALLAFLARAQMPSRFDYVSYNDTKPYDTVRNYTGFLTERGVAKFGLDLDEDALKKINKRNRASFCVNGNRICCVWTG